MAARLAAARVVSFFEQAVHARGVRAYVHEHDAGNTHEQEQRTHSCNAYDVRRINEQRRKQRYDREDAEHRTDHVEPCAAALDLFPALLHHAADAVFRLERLAFKKLISALLRGAGHEKRDRDSHKHDKHAQAYPRRGVLAYAEARYLAQRRKHDERDRRNDAQESCNCSLRRGFLSKPEVL